VSQMTTPQLEDGYTRIANELLEAMSGFGFTQHQFAVLLAIVRKTYGYNKKSDDISASQLADICNLPRNHVTVAVNKLVSLNVVTKSKGQYGSILGINKNYRLWGKSVSLACENTGDTDSGTESVLGGGTKSVLALVVQNLDSSGTENVPSAGTESVHTKDNLTKDNKKKKVSSPERCFADWLEHCKTEGKKPIPEGHAVFRYADSIELPIEYVRLAWLEFKNKFSNNRKKKYIDWAAAFHEYVRKNWLHLWYAKDGAWQLTTAGLQLQKEMRGA
jgi:phage replication O-like protein O